MHNTYKGYGEDEMTDLVTLTPYKKAESKKDITIRQLKKENAELENKIADIKANYDLAIEGRDVKIMELEEKNNKLLDVINGQDVKIADLEKKNEELTERIEDLQEQNSEMFNTIALQEQQIEKMKCCGNCKKEGVCDNDCAKYKDNYHEWELWNV